MALSRVGPWLVAGLLAALLSAGRAEAGNEEESRVFQDKATAAFALGNHAAAAEAFEKAFELAPAPALLYNAAQAHRLAGNKERALTLYQNYWRVYGRKEKRAEVAARIEELTQAIERDKAAAAASSSSAASPAATKPDSGGVTAEPARGATLAVPLAPEPKHEAAAAVLVAQPAAIGEPSARGQDDTSLVKKPWFWAAVGGGVAVAVTVVLILTLSGSKDPEAKLGMVPAN